MLEHQRSSQRKDRLMKHLDCNTKSLLTKGLILTLALVLSVVAYAVATEINRARAESVTTKAWVLSSTYVNIRMGASKKAPIVGQLDPGDDLEIDGKVDGWFAHIVAPVDGWIHSGYLTFSKPKQVNQTYTVTAKKRLMCRRWIDGPKVAEKPYLINGSEVKVLWISSEWACTNRGYLKSEWLEENAE